MLPLLLAGAGLLALNYTQKKSTTAKNSPAQPNSKPSKQSAIQPTQPSQVYPWSAIIPPRVDNKNQPWYNNSRQFMADASSGNVKGLAGDTSSIVHSLSDIWGSLGLGGGDDAKANLMSADSMPTDEDVDDSATPDDQSNVVGNMSDEEYADADDGSYDSVEMGGDYDEDYGSYA